MDGSTSSSRPGRTLGSVVRLATPWKLRRAVLPMICRSSSAEPTPGTCTRIAVGALALDRGLAGARLVHPAADDLEALLHGALVERRLLRLGQGDDQLVAVGPRLELAGARAGDREDGLRHLLRRRQRRVDAGGVADADAQLLRARVQPPHVADLVAQVAEPVAQVGPEPLQLLGVHLLGLDLHQDVRAAPEVEAEVDQPRRRPRTARATWRARAPASAPRRAPPPCARRWPARPARRRSWAA